ncbi:MAG TPA: oxalurate catabolism protein HpxZ [Acidimicrobiales bacterium]
MPLEVNRPDVVVEVQAVFDAYEAALIANDVDALDAFFWDSPEVVRFGVADRQHGHDEIAAFRRHAPSAPPPRTLENTVVTTFGSDTAVVTTEFRSEGHPGVGRQSQIWVRIDGGWRVVSAHVSIVDGIT